MMETKLWCALCALLLINLASAEHDNNHITPTTGAAKTDARTSQVAPGLNSTSHAAPALNVPRTNSSSTNTTAGGESTGLTPTAKNDSEANVSLTVNNKTEPTASSVAGHATTSHLLPTSAVTSPPHSAHAAPVNATSTTRPTHHPSPPPAQPETSSSSAVANQTKPETNASATTSSGSTPGSSAPQEQPANRTQAHTSPQPQPAATQAQTQSTVSPTGNSSTPTKANANTPSQLNVGGGTTMAHESHTLNPLLAGLVSAFVITAVIVILLLFLKLRRRDNRPGFRRLQDLPMDDMEDTPLSMYTY